MKLVISDLDEVVFSWHGAFETYVRTVRGYNPEGPISKCRNLEEWMGISYEKTHELVYDFNHDFSRFGDLKPLSHAAKYIPLLNAAGYKFIAITAASCDTPTYHARWDNLQRYFPDMFIGLHLTGLGGSKKPYLELYRPAYWVEDKPRHAEDGFKAGHKSFLIDYVHNMNDDRRGVKRVSGWKEVHDCILGNNGHGCEYLGWMA